MLKDIINGLLEIIYPKSCAICKKGLKGISHIDNLVCAECWAKIKCNLPPFCYRCGRHLGKSDFTRHICPACIRRPPHFDRAFSPCVYEGVIKELIHEFKYNGKDHFGLILSKPMIAFIKEYNLPIEYVDFIIPIPLYKTRLREREFNQAGVLSNHIAKEFKKNVLDNILIRHRQTKTQTELEEQERILNVQNSFSIPENGPIKGKNILLVDDVLTTAATCSEAAKTLKNSGVNIVFVLTLAN